MVLSPQYNAMCSCTCNYIKPMMDAIQRRFAAGIEAHACEQGEADGTFLLRDHRDMMPSAKLSQSPGGEGDSPRPRPNSLPAGCRCAGCRRCGGWLLGPFVF